MKVVALGGCGAMGRATSWELAENEAVNDLLIADADIDSADEFAAELPGDVETAHVDVTDHESRSSTPTWSPTPSRTRLTSR